MEKENGFDFITNMIYAYFSFGVHNICTMWCDVYIHIQRTCDRGSRNIYGHLLNTGLSSDIKNWLNDTFLAYLGVSWLESHGVGSGDTHLDNLFRWHWAHRMCETLSFKVGDEISISFWLLWMNYLLEQGRKLMLFRCLFLCVRHCG